MAKETNFLQYADDMWAVVEEREEEKSKALMKTLTTRAGLVVNEEKMKSSGEAGHPCFSPHSLIYLHVPFWPPGIPPTMAVAGASV